HFRIYFLAENTGTTKNIRLSKTGMPPPVLPVVVKDNFGNDFSSPPQGIASGIMDQIEPAGFLVFGMGCRKITGKPSELSITLPSPDVHSNKTFTFQVPVELRQVTYAHSSSLKFMRQPKARPVLFARDDAPAWLDKWNARSKG